MQRVAVVTWPLRLWWSYASLREWSITCAWIWNSSAIWISLCAARRNEAALMWLAMFSRQVCLVRFVYNRASRSMPLLDKTKRQRDSHPKKVVDISKEDPHGAKWILKRILTSGDGQRRLGAQADTGPPPWGGPGYFLSSCRPTLYTIDSNRIRTSSPRLQTTFTPPALLQDSPWFRWVGGWGSDWSCTCIVF